MKLQLDQEDQVKQLTSELRDAHQKVAELSDWNVKLDDNQSPEDRVDELLAKFFDQHEDGGQLKTLMSKESPGTYHFGTKRVTIEADQAGELFV